MISLLALSVLRNLVVVLFLLVCAAIMLIVLLQKGRGGGVSAAFGGGGGAGSLLGTKTGDFLTWVTICLVAAFLVLAVLMGKFLRPKPMLDLAPPSMPTTALPTTDVPVGDVSMPDVSVPAEGQTPAAADQAADVAEDAAPAPEAPAETTE